MTNNHNDFHMRIPESLPWVLLVALLGCSDGGNITSPLSSHLKLDGVVPMKVGYQWVYLWSSYDTAGRQSSGHELDTVRIVRDTSINAEHWFIFSDGVVRTNRADGVWFLAKDGPRLGFPATLNDSTCTAPTPFQCEYYLKLVQVNRQIHVVGGTYAANVYDWMFPNLGTWSGLGYRYYTTPHLGHVRIESYSTSDYGYRFLAYSQELISSNVE